MVETNNGPVISRKWHYREDRNANRLLPRQHALNWMRYQVFERKQTLDDLMKMEGGSGSWWIFYQFGMVRLKGILRVSLLGEHIVEEFSIKALYDAVQNEKQQPYLL